jgi:hypothetical protein
MMQSARTPLGKGGGTMALVVVDELEIVPT